MSTRPNGTRWVRGLAAAVWLLSFSCDPAFLDPQIPEHRGERGHAQPEKTPFLCRDPNAVILNKEGEDPKIGGSARPTDGSRPADNRLSCDALYSHGGYEYRADQASTRHLSGSDSPSCYTCHGDEWKDD